MYLVLLLTAAALASPIHAASVNKNLKMLPPNLVSESAESDSPSKPSLRKSLQITRHSGATQRRVAGRVLELRCDAAAAPAPRVQWLRNNRPILEFDQESNEIIDASPTSLAQIRSSLIISRPSANDVDVYTCLVTSGRKTESYSTTVYNVESTSLLSERYKLLPLEPRIVTSYKVYMDFIGNNVVLPCRAKGHPRPLVRWYDNNGELVGKDSRLKVLRSGELLIPRIKWSDMGGFTCHATNSFGTSTASTFLYPVKAG